MSKYTKYRLYQKYETRGSQEAIPCYPNLFSIDGDGTMPLVIVEENSRDCGYTGETQPIYRWYQLPIDTYYYCDACQDAQYKWVNLPISQDWECGGTTKDYKQKKMVSVDGGSTWTDVEPPQYQRGALYEQNSSSCGYRTRTSSGSPYCEGYDKYVDVYSQYSTDGGNTWQTTATTPTMVEHNSEYCGYIEPQYRTTSGDTYCSGYNKYVPVYNQVSYDGGITWTTTAATEVLVESYSQDCGYVPLTRWVESGWTCVGYDKYVNNVQQISYDDGQTWQNTSNTSASTLIESYSTDCGVMYRWTDSDVTVCNEENKYYLAYKEMSLDNGQTWQEVVPRETSLGTLIESQACECMTHAELLENGDYSFIGTHGGIRSTCQSSRDYVSQTQVDAVGSPLLKVSIGNCISRIISYTFDGEKQLVDVVLPESLRTIGEYAFDFCVALKCINFPNGLQTIGDYAFARCRSIKEVILPDTVTDVASTAFQECSAITTVRFSSGMTTAQGFATCGNLSNVTIPYGIRSVGDFQHCGSLRSIEIPHSVTSVGGFANSGLQSITIPNSVTSIGGMAFDSTPLTSITFESGTVLDFSGKSTFKYCQGLQTIELPSGTTSVVEDMFGYCNRLTSVTLPDTVRSIGNYAFENCTSLNTLVLKSVTPPTVGSYAFDYVSGCRIYVPCGTLQDYCTSSGWSAMCSSIQENPSSQCRWVEYGTTCINYSKYVNNIMQISYDGGQTWANTPKTSASTLIEEMSPDCLSGVKLVSVTNSGDVETVACDSHSYITSSEVPNKTSTSIVQYTAYTVGNCVSRIYSEAFKGRRATVIHLPNSLTDIGVSSFANCYRLTSIEIPSSVTSIGASGFCNCSVLTSVTFGENSQLTSIGNDRTGRTFFNCSSLTSINIPSRVTTIGEYTFSGCTNLTSITFSQDSQMTTFGGLQGCGNITSITIPDSVTSIGWSALFDCHSLTSVTIPSGVTSINTYAFYRCTSLTSITILATTPPALGTDTFTNTNNCPIYVPSGSVETYKATSGWSDYASRIQAIQPTIQTKWIATYSDSHTESAECDSTSAITSAEINLTNLVSAEIGDCVTSIGNDAFRNCTGLTSCTIGSGVTSIGERSFQYCSSFTSIVIPSGVTSIAGAAFDSCTGLTSIDIPNSVTSIGESAFGFCSSLTSIDIPNSVTSIGDFVFYGCSGLISVTVNATTPPTLGEVAFGNTNNCPIYVPAASVEAYKAASGWSSYASRIQAIP